MKIILFENIQQINNEDLYGASEELFAHEEILFGGKEIPSGDE
jgi:hypothetical protein